VQRWISILFASFLCSAAAASSAHAGNLTTAHFGGEQGNVASDHPTTIYYNPAGLALGSGWRLYLEGDIAWRTVEYRRSESAISNIDSPEGEAGTPSDAVGANAGKASVSNIAAAPFLGVVTDLGVPGLGIGAAFYVPFGGQATWDKNDDFDGNAQYPGAVDGPNRWFDIHGQLRSLYVTLAGAYRFAGPRLSIGAGINFTESNIWTVRARTPEGTDDVVGANGRIAEGRSLVDTSGFALAASAGVNWEPAPGLWIGASYQSQPGFGNSTQSGTLTNKFGTGSTDTTDIRIEQEMPDVYRLGARYQPMPGLELRLAGDFQRWSAFEHQCLLDKDANPSAKCKIREDGSAFGPDVDDIILNIPREWQDTFGVSAGGSYWVMPALELESGLYFDSSSVPDKTLEASLPDQNKLFVRAGVRWAAMPDQLLITLALNNAFYFKRTVGPREDGAIGTMSPSTVPDGAGSYKQNVMFVNLGAEYRF
jgi:long-chain fatty acid transport protein